jgi:hypothetical protein
MATVNWFLTKLMTRCYDAPVPIFILTKDAVFDTLEPLFTTNKTFKSFLHDYDLRRLHMKKYVLAVLLVFAMAVPAMAATTINIDQLNQADFKSFSEDFGMALSYQPVSPAAPLGDKLPGFDAGVEVSYVKLDKGATYFQKMDSITTATGKGELPNALIIPRIHVQVGLPIIPIDLGVSYSSIPSSDIKLIGYEIKYAVLKGGLAMPAVAIRGAYTKLSGVDVLDLSTKSLDISISKGILIFTPYAGVGQVWITSEPHITASAVVPLAKEDISKTKVFVGTKVKVFPFINLVVEGAFSNIKEYTARLNVNF